MFSHRSARRCEPEWMDRPGLDRAAHRQALDGLARINRISRSANIYWPEVLQLASSQRSRTWTVLDVASGAGDVPIALAKRAQSAGLQLAIDGCDISAVAVEYASEQARAHNVHRVQFLQHDALSAPIPGDYDIITCSLFLHHLEQAAAESLLRKMAAAARRLLLVNDLRRTRLGYALSLIGCRALSRSPIVHNDGPISARAAFDIHEIQAMASRSGLHGAEITRRWPQRFLLSWKRP